MKNSIQSLLLRMEGKEVLLFGHNRSTETYVLDCIAAVY